MANKEKQIALRSSAAEFLIFSNEAQESSIEVRYENDTVWLSQKMMATLFDCSTDNISLHLKKIFEEDELNEKSVTEYYSATAADGKSYTTKHYNLDAVISVGYRVNSKKAVQFRKWATIVIREFSIKGYVLDKDRLKNGAVFTEEYFENLLEEIREIRLSERKFYQKITDIYATSMDYDVTSKTTKEFFARVQNKLHFAIHGHTAAEMIVDRANAEKDHMGLTSWERAPSGKILKNDVSIAKNYLNQEELSNLERIVSLYLDFAELQARRHIPMTMEDWAKRLDAFLKFNEYEILNDAGKVSAEVAKLFAESEFEKYRVVQDKLFHSDFDGFLEDSTVIAIEKKKE